MTQQDPSLTAVARLASVQDEDLAAAARSPAGRDLFESIVAPPARAGRRRARAPRFALAVPALAIVAAVAATLAGVATQPAAAGIDFETRGGYIVATVTDPDATASQLRAAFAERGLDIELELVAASPSLVGTVVMDGGSGSGRIRTLHAGRCMTPGGGCPVGLAIPLDFEGHAELALGRAAREGERFVSSGDALAPGEPLHCSGVRGMRVARAQEVIERRGLRASWRLHDEAAVSPAVAANAFVADATPVAPGEVLIGITRRPPEPLSAHYERALAAGCG